MGLKIRIKLDEVLKSRGLTQKQLVEMTNIWAAAICELYNNQRVSINKDHLELICKIFGETNGLFPLHYEHWNRQIQDNRDVDFRIALPGLFFRVNPFRIKIKIPFRILIA